MNDDDPNVRSVAFAWTYGQIGWFLSGVVLFILNVILGIVNAIHASPWIGANIVALLLCGWSLDLQWKDAMARGEEARREQENDQR